MKKVLLLIFSISIFTFSCNKNDSTLAPSNPELLHPTNNSGVVEVRSDAVNPLDAII